LDDVSPIVVGKIGESGELLWVMVEITEYESGVLGKGSGVFDDVIHGVDVLGAFSGNGVGSGETVKVDKRDALFAVSRVKVDVLKSSLVVEGGNGIIEGGRVRL